MKKLIGITPGAFSGSIEKKFVNCSAKVLTFNDLNNLDMFSGMVFSGGEDISPEIYGEKNKYSTTNPKRDAIEKFIFTHCLKNSIKCLGICRGHQFINAMLGGQLVQDLEYDLGIWHENIHEIFTEKGSIINLLGIQTVNSLHHQGVIYPGETLNPTSRFSGVIESTESDQFLTVQWHPEIMDNSKIFSFFEEMVNDN